MIFGDERLPIAFWDRLKINEDGCWEPSRTRKPSWTPPRRRYDSWRGMTTHLRSYRLAIGEIPTGLRIDHLCANGSCCNPLHLEAVTRRVIALRAMWISDRATAGKANWTLTKYSGR